FSRDWSSDVCSSDLYAWAGAELGAKLLYLWGVPLGNTSLRSRAKDALYHRLYRRKMLNSFEFSDDRVRSFYAVHNRRRPEVVVEIGSASWRERRAEW